MTHSGCGSKRKFPSAGAARQSMRRMQGSGKVLGECAVYPCKICGGWHWGRARGTRLDRAAQTIAAIDRAIDRDHRKKDATP